MRRTGISMIHPVEGIRWIELLLCSSPGLPKARHLPRLHCAVSPGSMREPWSRFALGAMQVSLVPFKWRVYHANIGEGQLGFFAKFAAPEVVRTATWSGGASTGDSLATVESELVAIIKKSFGVALQTADPLSRAGFDSLSMREACTPACSHLCRTVADTPARAGAVELRDLIQSTFQLSLPATLIYDYPTVDSLAGFIHLKKQRLTESQELYRVVGVTKAPGDSTDLLLSIVQQMLGPNLKAQSPLASAGLDSLMSLELREHIERSNLRHARAAHHACGHAHVSCEY